MSALADELECVPEPENDFATVREHVDKAVAARQNAVTILLALAPFEHFEHTTAEALLNAMDSALVAAAEALEKGERTHSMASLRVASEDWPPGHGNPSEDLVAKTFGVSASPLDDIGDFKPGQVFEAYKYDNGRLFAQLAPHLESLEVPMPGDSLTTVAVVGWISAAPDPVVANMSMRSMLNALGHADPGVGDQVLAHFRGRERVSRQARRDVLRKLAEAKDEAISEDSALAMAYVYKRLAEGPLRHFGWTLRCLLHGEWSQPPTLTPVYEAMVAAGGFARNIAEQAIHVAMRNGEAHENLEWDGLQGAYMVEGRSIDPAQVAAACIIALSFDRGCEAAVALYRSMSLGSHSEAGPPRAHDGHRMPAWQRAESYFGTNGLRVLDARFNEHPAQITVAHFNSSSINPCFQALLCARSLLPEVSEYQVFVEDQTQPVVHVGAEALDHALPVWQKALASFDRMPFSTFLPVNLRVRSEHEPSSVAIRSVAWIAADDLLDALDGSPAQWDAKVQSLFCERSALVEAAVESCLSLEGAKSTKRLQAILDAVHELHGEFERRPTELLSFTDVDQLHCVQRVRLFWDAWGPVPRLPNVAEVKPQADHQEPQPARHESSSHPIWNTL